MNDHQHLTDAQVSSLALGAGRTELLEEIMSTPVVDRVDHEARQRRRPPRWTAVLAAAVLVAAIVALPVWLDQRDTDRPLETPPAGQQEAPGERAILPLAGWRIDNLDDGVTEGEIRYEKGDQQVQVNWRAADDYDDYVADRSDLGAPTTVDLFGTPSKLWAYSPQDHTVIRPIEGSHFFEVRGDGMGEAAFLALLGQLQQVGDADFGAALPDTMVTPANVDATIAGILADIDTPAGFDPASIHVPGFNDRYDVVAEATGQVTCAWVNQYAVAGTSGDQASRDEAVTAMAGSRDWSALKEIEPQGDWSSFIWEIADDLVAGRPVSSFLGGGSCQNGRGL